MRSFIVLFGMCGLISAALAQSPEVEWVLQLGFENDEIISDVVSLSDGGFAAIGVEQYYPPELAIRLMAGGYFELAQSATRCGHASTR